MPPASDTPAYEVVLDWAKIPTNWDLVEVPGLAVDSKDRLFAFTRGKPPVVVFDRDGRVLDSWGTGKFRRPHAACIGPDDCLYCVDDFAHAVRKYAVDGTLLGTIGPAGSPSETGYVPDDFLSVKRGGPPYNLPTSIAFSVSGEIYVSDANGGAGGTGAIFRVDPVTGAQTLLTSGGNLVEPEQVTLDLSGDLIVAEYNSKIIRVNRLTGAQTMVSTGSYLVNAYGPFVTASGEILVADVNAYGGGGALIRIDPTSGVQRMVYWDGTLTDPVNVYAVPGAAATGGDIVVNSGLTINMAAGYNNVTVASGGKLVVDGTLNAAGNMTVQSGGSVSHTVRSLAGATLIVSGTMDVQTGGLIDLDALGLRGGNNGSAFGSTGETLSPTSETTIIAGAVGSNAGAGASFGGNGASGGTGSPSRQPPASATR